MPKIKEIVSRVWGCEYCEETFQTQAYAEKHEVLHACEHPVQIMIFEPGWSTKDEKGSLEPVCENCLIPMDPEQEISMNVYQTEHQALLRRLYDQAAQLEEESAAPTAGP